MNIRRWHVGKLYLLWGWGATIEGFLYVILKGTPERPAADGSIVVYLSLILLMLALPLWLSTITWKWLSGREVHEETLGKSSEPDVETIESRNLADK